ncbi:MAG: hypothetical protein KY476_01540 [Planctomycetes bacterium]|nr:hypothetical protein [Planctomycetota bacterium]
MSEDSTRIPELAEQETTPSLRPAASSGRKRPARRAKKDRAAIWQLGLLFHCTNRFPRRPDLPRIDRLAGILRHGLIAPGSCEDGSVRSDLNLTVVGTDLPYDSLVFLHRFGPESWLYTMAEPGRFAVLIDPALPVLTPDDMGRHWAILSQDEVYVRDRVPPQHLTGVAVYPTDVATVRSELLSEFQRLAIPLYDYDGNVHWRPE